MMVTGSHKRRLILKVFLYFCLVIGLLFAILPIIWMISCSFKSNSDIFSLEPKLIDKIDTSAYINIFSDPEKIRYFINSLIVSSAVTILTLIVAILAGYAFSRFSFKGKKALNMFIMSTQAVPPITLIIPYFGMVVTLNLYNSYYALILTYLVFTLPYAITMMTGYFNTLPKALDEAVQIDGGSHRTVLWRILVPISMPGMVSTGIYTFLQCWNEYLYALTLTKTQDMRTVPVGIQLLMGQHTYEWNEMMAMSVLGAIPIVIIFMFFQKYFMAGMTSGAVKS